MSWIDRIFSKGTSSSASRKANVPEGVWTKCTSCEQVLYGEEVKRNLYVCPKCGHHMRIDARERLLALLDEGSSQELSADLEPKDILKFKDLKKYKDIIDVSENYLEGKHFTLSNLFRVKTIPKRRESHDWYQECDCDYLRRRSCARHQQRDFGGGC